MEDSSGIHRMIDEFAAIRPQYVEYGRRLAELLRSLLDGNSIHIHSVEWRAKTVESFRDKLLQPGKNYQAVSQVRDLCGLRLILYHPADVQKAAQVIRNEFQINEEQSGNTADRLAPNEFGYLSLHLIVSLAYNRLSLPEWSRFQGLNAEIQVRTVLQHAWAAISHALQYKREAEVPLSLRRRLFRLSGLLELADEEFASLNAAHQQLISHLTDTSPPDFAKQTINRLSLTEFMQRSDLPARIAKIGFSAGFGDANKADWEIPELDSEHDTSELAAMCAIADLKTVKELDDSLNAVLAKSNEFFERLAASSPGIWWASPPFFVGLLIILANPDSFSADQLTSDLGWNEEIATRVIRAVSPSVVKESGEGKQKKNRT